MNDIQALSAGECFLVNNALDVASGFRISCILQMSEQKGSLCSSGSPCPSPSRALQCLRGKAGLQILLHWGENWLMCLLVLTGSLDLVSEIQVPSSLAHASAPPICSIRIILLLEPRRLDSFWCTMYASFPPKRSPSDALTLPGWEPLP